MRKSVSEEGPDPIDRHVGTRIRGRRVGLRISQTKLGHSIGVTFQQIQKYESGTNRVGASNLFKIVDNLAVIDYNQYDPDKMDALKVAVEKCPMKRVILVGRPREKDLEAVADKKVPDVVQADFKTTVDQTEWHG